jgi:DNA-directed RNA polymerase subunit H (RpoH/RPB5)
MSEKPENKIIPQLIPIEKSRHQKINEIKLNIVKMFKNRNFFLEENVQKYSKKLFDSDNDDLEFILILDNDVNYNTQIKHKKIYIKIFEYKISSVNKNSPVGEFLSKNSDQYKLIVVEDINEKSKNTIAQYDTSCEIFKMDELKINIVDHILVPKYTVLTKEEADDVLKTYNAKKKDMPLISSADPIARYYNMKPDDICKIERASVMTCQAPFYRIVVKAKMLKAKA